MDGKYIALTAIVTGIGSVIAGFSTMGEGASGLDRLPLTILLIVGGAVVATVGGLYLLVRAFAVL